ncbi:hypothetical protein G6O69_18305 [Pseudenhygromyxa sp. WMMC2535]|uniref:type I-G CRISPR-associated protein, Cas3-extension family n=1 Tax=Pseudenhygromyxa sp. WMMC2535 TaxID=2712867 RepID=UPI0015521ABE|nr:hypothetical protein [Pseudenhygromyxa sp. WMMC2535]NVB39802.1 hypothetical protein [Pseudenhygromyxa sp. WMMC2535]
MSTHEIRLTGLDAQDPLGFLAALGCLAALTEQLRRAGEPEPAMYFELDAAIPVPVLCSALADGDAVIELLQADLDALAGRGRDHDRDRDRDHEEDGPDPFLAFSYADDKGNQVRDLKPKPADFRRVAQEWIAAAEPGARRSVDWAAAVLTDVATDNNGNAKPFALHFTAGQQRFLTIAHELMHGAGSKPRERGVDREDLRAAVFGPWPNDRQLKVFSWSPTQDRPYALRAIDPSSDQKLGTPGADWLALRGLVLLSSAPSSAGRRWGIRTGGVEGRWKDGRFSYPLWPRPLGEDLVRSLLRHPAVCEKPSASALRSLPRGVEVLTCRISRSEQGGYGAFSRPTRH